MKILHYVQDDTHVNNRLMIPNLMIKKNSPGAQPGDSSGEKGQWDARG